VFREPREYCARKSQQCRSLLQRKFFYFFTCEYCFSHYVTALFLWMTHFKLLMDDWRGYVLSFFALVFVANVYMNFYGRVRVEINVERAELKVKEQEVERKEDAPGSDGSAAGSGDGAGGPDGGAGKTKRKPQGRETKESSGPRSA